MPSTGGRSAPKTPTVLLARSPDHRDAVRISGSALNHVSAHRQRRIFSKEAGGQIFGNIHAGVLSIVAATGPYQGDHRSRFAYRSNPTAAQSAIVEQAAQGRSYLGEWHTHSEDLPEPSAADLVAVRALLAASQLSNSDLFLLIVGRIDPPGGLTLLSFVDGSSSRWTFECQPHC
jgi:integrative and conjugative element protein (TIGR02256 family)